MTVATVDISPSKLQEWLDANPTATIKAIFEAGTFIFIIYE